MFGKKEKAAIAALHPQHQALLNDRALAITQSPEQWAQLFGALAVPNPAIRKRQLPPRMMDVVVPILRVISEDVERTDGIGVNLDLRGADAPGKTGPGQQLQAYGNISKLEQFISWDPWLVIDATLRDGSHLTFSIIDVVRTRKIRKRGQSGKIKWKTKSKVTQRVAAQLTLPKGRQAVPPAPSPATSWLAVSAKPKGNKVVVTARGKYNIPPAPKPGWQVDTVLLVVAELFRWAAPPPEPSESAAAPSAGAPA